eukprot:gene17167-23651_t
MESSINYSQDIDNELYRLLTKRRLLENKTLLRLETLKEFNNIKKESQKRLVEAVAKQNEEAKLRNLQLLDNIHRVVGIETNSTANTLLTSTKSDVLLKEAKEKYVKHVEATLPLYHRNNALKQEEKIKKIKLEKLASIKRREALKIELMKEDFLKNELENQRRELVLSLALEQRDLLESNTNSLIMANEGKALDKIIFNQIESMNSEFQSKMMKSNERIIQSSHIISSQFEQLKPTAVNNNNIPKDYYSLNIERNNSNNNNNNINNNDVFIDSSINSKFHDVDIDQRYTSDERQSVKAREINHNNDNNIDVMNNNNNNNNNNNKLFNNEDVKNNSIKVIPNRQQSPSPSTSIENNNNSSKHKTNYDKITSIILGSNSNDNIEDEFELNQTNLLPVNDEILVLNLPTSQSKSPTNSLSRTISFFDSQTQGHRRSSFEPPSLDELLIPNNNKNNNSNNNSNNNMKETENMSLKLENDNIN